MLDKNHTTNLWKTG